MRRHVAVGLRTLPFAVLLAAAAPLLGQPRSRPVAASREVLQGALYGGIIFLGILLLVLALKLVGGSRARSLHSSGAQPSAPLPFDPLVAMPQPTKARAGSTFDTSRLAEFIPDRYRDPTSDGADGRSVRYRATDTVEERPVVVALLSPELASAPRSKIAFLSEARAAASLSHPAVPATYEVASEPWPRIVTAPVEGELLSARLAGETAMTCPEALSLVASLAEVLAHAHARGVTHENLSPAAVTLSPAGDVFLTDFRPTPTASPPGPDVEALGRLLEDATAGLAPHPDVAALANRLTSSGSASTDLATLAEETRTLAHRLPCTA